jgi:acetaldehyde dehydrogenase
VHPADDLGPEGRAGVATDQCADVLQGHAAIPVVPEQLLAPAGSGLVEGNDGARRDSGANIDEFTETTARAIEVVGGADRGKAIIVLNPAEPPMIMRDTVLCLVDGGEPDAIRASVESMVAEVARYVPGYRLKQAVQVTPIPPGEPLDTLIGPGASRPAWQVTVFLEVEGAAHYLPAYAGNLDIMTSAALRTGELLAARPVGATL